MIDLIIQDLTPNLLQKGAQQGERQEVTIYRAYVEGGYTMREIGEYIGMHYSSISLVLRRYEQGQ